MILEKFSLKNQVGIVTGGGQGLGEAFCGAFAEVGADIVIAVPHSVIAGGACFAL